MSAVGAAVLVGTYPFILTHSVSIVSSSTNLTRTAGALTDGTKQTVAFWIKAIANGGRYSIWSGNSGSGQVGFELQADNTLLIVSGNTFSPAFNAPSTNTIADTTTWHHVCFAIDTNQGTASNRVHIYLDGTEVTYNASASYPGLASPMPWNSTLEIGNQLAGASIPANVKFADYYQIDGQQLTPASFIYGTGSGTCHPKRYVGSYGAQGFHMDFNLSNGADTSGNGNTWTVNGSPTFGTDVPT